MFLATNLTEGEHHITLTDLGGPTGNALDFDWAVVNSTRAPDIGGNNSTNTTTGSSDNPGNSTSTSTSHSNHTGAIVGGVVGGVVGLALIAGLVWFFFFKRKRKYEKAKTYDPTLDLNAEPNGNAHHHLDGGEVAPFPSTSGRTGPDRRTSTQLYHSTSAGSTDPPRDMSEVGYSSTAFTTSLAGAAGARTAGERPNSGFFSAPAPPPSNATSYPLSEEGGTYTNLQPASYQAFPEPSPHSSPANNSVPPPSSSGDTALSSDLNTPSVNQSQRQPGSLKSAAVNLPYTARPPTSPPVNTPDPATTDPTRDRMVVPGREVDLGPVVHDEDDHAVQGTLPPDYHQATQPLPGQRPDTAGS